MNVLVPALGTSAFYKEYLFPKLLFEIDGVTMLERVVNNLKSFHSYRPIFIFDAKQCSEFHLDSSVNLLTEGNSKLLLRELHNRFINGRLDGSALYCSCSNTSL